ncbi:hypothetical protein Tco_0993525 [Tanacetum coccineum]
MQEPTMEEYMMKTQEYYGSGIAKPNIDEKAHFELKGQFLKELRDNNFSGLNNNDANEHNEKDLEIVDLFHIPEKFLSKYCLPAQTAKKMEEINKFQYEPNKTLYQALEQFKELLLRCPRHYLMDMQEVILFYKGLDVPTRQILDSKGAIPSMKAVNAKKAIQDMVDHSQKCQNERQLGIEMNEKVYAAQVGCESCGGPHYTKDCQLKEEGKPFEEPYYTQFRASFPQGGRYRAAAPGFYQRDNENPSYQERIQKMEESLSKFMAEYAKRHDENSNLIKEIRASTDAATMNQGASIKHRKFKSGK